jgi:hypothetical protein
MNNLQGCIFKMERVEFTKKVSPEEASRQCDENSNEKNNLGGLYFTMGLFIAIMAISYMFK